MIQNGDVVDWLMIELRDAPSAMLATGATMVDQKAAFVLKNGSVVATDGNSMLKSYTTFFNNPYVVVWHRNHLGVLSANPMTLSGMNIYSYDFSTAAGQAYQSGHKHLGGGIYGMYGGDGQPDQMVDYLDKQNTWYPEAGSTGYKPGDFNLDTQIGNKDKNDVWVPNRGNGTKVPN